MTAVVSLDFRACSNWFSHWVACWFGVGSGMGFPPGNDLVGLHISKNVKQITCQKLNLWELQFGLILIYFFQHAKQQAGKLHRASGAVLGFTATLYKFQLMNSCG